MSANTVLVQRRVSKTKVGATAGSLPSQICYSNIHSTEGHNSIPWARYASRQQGHSSGYRASILTEKRKLANKYINMSWQVPGRRQRVHDGITRKGSCRCGNPHEPLGDDTGSDTWRKRTRQSCRDQKRAFQQREPQLLRPAGLN